MCSPKPLKAHITPKFYLWLNFIIFLAHLLRKIKNGLKRKFWYLPPLNFQVFFPNLSNLLPHPPFYLPQMLLSHGRKRKLEKGVMDKIGWKKGGGGGDLKITYYLDTVKYGCWHYFIIINSRTPNSVHLEWPIKVYKIAFWWK